MLDGRSTLAPQVPTAVGLSPRANSKSCLQSACHCVCKGKALLRVRFFVTCFASRILQHAPVRRFCVGAGNLYKQSLAQRLPPSPSARLSLFAQHLNAIRPGVFVTITPDLFHRLKDTGGSLTKQAGSTFDRAA
jgi:hypothetical protein